MHESGIPTIAELSNNPMLAKEHLESARAKINDSLRKGLPTVKVFAANEPRRLAPCGVLLVLVCIASAHFCVANRPHFGFYSQVRILVHLYIRMVQLYRDSSVRQDQLNVKE